MNEAAEQIAAFDLRVDRSRVCISLIGRDECERSVLPLRVVVARVGAEHLANSLRRHPISNRSTAENAR